MSRQPGDTPTATRAGRTHGRRRGVWRHLGLTALGTVVPGAGLAAAGRRWAGGLLLLLTAAAIGVGIYIAWTYGLLSSTLNLAVRPALLRGVSIAVAVAAVVWVVSILATARTTRPASPTGAQRLLSVAFAGLMCLVVLAPAAQLVRYLNIQRGVVTTMFGGKHESPSSEGVVQATPEITEDDPWANTPRVNLLLLGSDSGADRVGTRTDSMMVASIDTQSGDTVLFGIPRNLQDVPFPEHDPLHAIYPDGYNCGAECLMNGVWTLASERKDLFPGDKNPGLTATRDAISAVLGLTIDYSVIIDLRGFQSLVDAMGGVTIDVEERIPIGGEVTADHRIVGIVDWIEAGRQHMNGYRALWYSRSRATTDDYSRMRRQRCMVGALIDQVNPVRMLERYPDLAAVARKNVQVDISEEELPAWVELVQRMQKAKIRSLPLTPSNISVTNPDFDAIHTMVRKAIRTKASTPTGTGEPTPTGTKTTPTGTRTTPADSGVDELVEVSQAC